MSYYSDVTIVTTIKGYNLICESAIEACQKYGIINPVLDEADVSINPTFDYVIMTWIKVTWYDTRRDVKAIIDSLDYRFPYRYVYIGEEGDYDVVKNECNYNTEYEEEMLPVPWISRTIMVEDRDGSTEIMPDEMVLFVTFLGAEDEEE